MRRFQLAAITASTFLSGGCVGHTTYDYYEPSGAGEIVTDLSGQRDPNYLEYVMFDQGDELLFLSCNYIGVKDTWNRADTFTDNAPHPNIGVAVMAKGSASVRSADEISHYLQQSLSIVIGNRVYAPLRVRVTTRWMQQIRAYVDFFEETQLVSQFELLLTLRNGQQRRLLFTRKHHDEWHLQKVA